MADRFPSLDEIDAGNTMSTLSTSCRQSPRLTPQPGTTEVKGDAEFGALQASAEPSDFLSRERALLGDDADQFSSANDNSATVQDADDDLLGGSADYNSAPIIQSGNDMGDFESSFPTIDTNNDVCSLVRKLPLIIFLLP